MFASTMSDTSPMETPTTTTTTTTTTAAQAAQAASTVATAAQAAQAASTVATAASAACTTAATPPLTPDQLAQQQQQQQAEYEAQYNEWKAAVDARVDADVQSIRNHLGPDTVTDEVARDLYVQANGEVVDAIAMYLDPAYATRTTQHIADQRAQDERDIHDLQTCNMEVDPQTAIRRLRAVTNAKDRVLVEVMRKGKEEKDEGRCGGDAVGDSGTDGVV